jgi:hypothetical protein
MEVKYAIDSHGHPLAFEAQHGSAAVVESGTCVVEAHCLGTHQKEALVRAHEGAPLWRLTSDEGAMLGGSDLAPFPLAYWNGALQLDLLERMHALARARGVPVSGIHSELVNHYAFDGSFFRGDGHGSAQPAQAQLRVAGGLDNAQAMRVAEEALAASPAHAAMATALTNTFALYVNGRRVPVREVPASNSADMDDPFRKYGAAPRPLAGARTDLVTRLNAQDTTVPVTAMPAEKRVDFSIGGHGDWPAGGAGGRAVSVIQRPGSTPYALIGGARAPEAMAYLCAGIAFCYMTQLVRYIEYLKYKVRGIRLSQSAPWRAGAGGAAFGPVDTHLFLTSEEPDEVNQKLLAMGARTCYLHAALGSVLPTRLDVQAT